MRNMAPMSFRKSDRGLSLMAAREREAARRHSPAWLILHGHQAFIVCRGCKRQVEIELTGYRLAEREHVDLRFERWSCTACGGRGEVRIVPPLGPAHRWRV